MTEQLLALAAPYGPVGLLCVYFVWREDKRDRRDEKRETERHEMDRDRIEADLSMARAITLLATKVER